MRRFCISLLSITLIVYPVAGQLSVDRKGNLGAKIETDSVASCFSVNGIGDSKVCTYIKTDTSSFDTGIKVIKNGDPNTSNDYTRGIGSEVTKNTASSKKIYGIYSRARVGDWTDTNSGRSYGIYAIAGNSTSGWNYGVVGALNGNNNGTGIYGSSESFDGGMNVGDKYAGFFHGKVKATDAMYATAFNITSDARLKENIECLEPEAIDDLQKLNVVKYNLRQFSVSDPDTSTRQVNYYTDESLVQRKHYGLIAQELQEIYPDLVYEGADGYLSVNYIEIIPFLIKAIQELTAKVDELEANPKHYSDREGEKAKTDKSIFDAILYQNNPNPFTDNTIVKCFIPKDTKSAVLYIYDMNGLQIDSMNVPGRGEVSVTIEGSSLDAGIYLYSLITDGVVVDTKRMILTK